MAAFECVFVFPCKGRPLSYHAETIPNRNSPPAILLRKAWRDGKRIRKQTLANLTHLPPELVEGIRRLLKGGVVLSAPDEIMELPDNPDQPFTVATQPTPLQSRALSLGSWIPFLIDFADYERLRTLAREVFWGVAFCDWLLTVACCLFCHRLYYW